MGPRQTARGIVRVVESGVENAIRSLVAGRGLTFSTFTLLVFGGAGGLHACGLARRLGIARILVPPDPGLFSALGLALSPCAWESSRTVLQRTRDLRTKTIDSLTEGMVREGTRQINRDDPSSGAGIRVFRTADLRYAGQSHELTLPVGPRLAQRFHRDHERAYGYARRGDEMELVTLRVRVEGPVPKLDWRSIFGATRPSGMATERRLPGRFSTRGSVRCLPRFSLPRHARLAGPLLVEEYSATTYVADGFELRVGDLGELVIEDRVGTRA